MTVPMPSPSINELLVDNAEKIIALLTTGEPPPCRSEHINALKELSNILRSEGTIIPATLTNNKPAQLIPTQVVPQ
jgi:hypothetical protein